MNFNKFKINGFGKLKSKEIYLEKGINIIYGENETGKSTLLKFISSMLYGISKNKNGKSISDFDRYKPWKTEEFSGKMEYELDNGENFEIYREFKKKNPLIYNTDKEDISKQFKENKTKGIDFFSEQTGIDEEIYYNTVIIEQESVKLDKSGQKAVIQRISNLVSSGNDNVSFQKSIAQINKLQSEKVGTTRTQNRPINIVNEDIEYLENKLKNIQNNNDLKNNDTKTVENLKDLLKIENYKKKFLGELKEIIENNRLKYAEIDFNRNLEEENLDKIEKLRAKLEGVEQQQDLQQNLKKENMIPYYIILGILILLGISLLIFLKNKIWGIVLCLCAIFEIIYIILKKNKSKKKIEKSKLDIKADIIKEINILKNNNEKIANLINEKLVNLNNEEKDKKNILKRFYEDKISSEYIDRFFYIEYDNIISEYNKITELEIKYNADIVQAKKDRDIMAEKEQEIANITERLAFAKEEREDLISLNNSYNIAKECLERAYEDVKRNISPKYENNLCNIVSKISDGKYEVIKFDDEAGLIVELDNGNYMSAERLSVGTIDQMYLSLRLSSLKEISSERMPIILDEVFAYFDNNRLKNIIKYLNEEYKDYQILIFTCTNREKDILKELNIEYNLINLEK